MDYKNTITVRLSKGHMNVMDGLFQYDYGQKLIFKGVELPESYEVHFSNDEHGESKTSIGNESGVYIPDEYLLSGDPVYFWVFLHDSVTDGYTEYSGKIDVRKRAKPVDIEPETVEHDAISDIVVILNEKSEQIDQIEIDVDQLRQDFNSFEETDPTVPSWAKEETKPSYTPQEVGALPSDTFIPSKVSDLQNDTGFISNETDPTVPEWAKQPTKPGYTPQEVGALPSDTFIPNKVSDLQNDSGFISEEVDPTVPNWAKQPTKPSYTYLEVGALPNNTFIPSKVSDLDNDEGYLTVETDPTVPSWAKQPNKPSYTAQEVGAMPSDTFVPSKVSDLENDEGYINTETDPTVPSWAKSPNKPTYTAQEVGALPDDTVIPTKVSDLTNDSGYISQETDPTVPFWAKQNTKPSYTAAEVGAVTSSEVNSLIATAIGDIHSFDVSIVQALPTQNIKEHTIYFVPKTGDTNDVYDEYIYVNNAWEMIGNTQIDLSDYATKSEIPAVPVQDVQTNGISILSNGIANIPLAGNSSGSLGVVKSSTDYGTAVLSSGILRVFPATSDNIKTGTQGYRPIVSEKQHEAVFYGLAKAAGADMKDSSNTVGTYTNEAKVAVKTMLGVEDPTVTDVQVNGVSVLSNGVANVPVASSSSIGVIKPGNGLEISSVHVGTINVTQAYSGHIKAGTAYFEEITPALQHESTFYGLAKAAGDTSQASSPNAVGTYTNEAKAAIKTMIGVIDPPVTDVIADGSSIVNNGIATMPIASADQMGIVMLGDGFSTDNQTRKTNVSYASADNIKAGASQKKSINPYAQHRSVFYGLAKAAGVDMADSPNAVGTYTAAAKTAIQSMLDVPSTSDMQSTVIVDDDQPQQSTNKLWIDTNEELAEFQVPTVSEMNTALNGKVSDVRINGSSIVNNGTANIPVASTSTIGTIKVGSGLYISSAGALITANANDATVKAGTHANEVITPGRQHMSVFYGLAKLAGADMANSSNPVGTFTDEAKVAIQKMLGIYEAPWELIKSGSITNEETTDFEITVGDDNQPFELTEAALQIIIPANTTINIGSYGTIRFYFGTASDAYRIVMLNNLTGPKSNTWYGSAYVFQRNGVIHYIGTPYSESGNNRAICERSNDGFVKAAQLLPIIKIRMLSVQGTLQYRLYGKRKWT